MAVTLPSSLLARSGMVLTALSEKLPTGWNEPALCLLDIGSENHKSPLWFGEINVLSGRNT